MPEVEQRMEQLPDAQERPLGMDARVPQAVAPAILPLATLVHPCTAQATAGMPEVEQRMEQLPDAQERPTSSGGSS
jgi:hypothetical protein